MSERRSTENAREADTGNVGMRRREFIGAGALLLAGAVSPTACVAFRRGSSTPLTLKTLDGDTIAVDSSAINELRQGLEGDAVGRGNA